MKNKIKAEKGKQFFLNRDKNRSEKFANDMPRDASKEINKIQ